MTNLNTKLNARKMDKTESFTNLMGGAVFSKNNLLKEDVGFFKLASLFLIIASSLSMAPLFAEEESNFSANVAMATDYMWRGYSQTTEGMAVSGGFDYKADSGFYLGTWASNVKFSTDSNIEFDLYGGFSGELENGVGWDVGVIKYIYPGTDAAVSGDIDWVEYHVSGSYEGFSAGINYTNDVYNSSQTGIYYTFGYGTSFGPDVGFAVDYNIYDYDDSIYANNIADYHVGVSKEFEGIGFDLSYYGSDADGKAFYGNNIADGRLVLSLSKSL